MPSFTYMYLCVYLHQYIGQPNTRDGQTQHLIRNLLENITIYRVWRLLGGTPILPIVARGLPHFANIPRNLDFVKY